MHSLCRPIIVYPKQKLWKKEEKEEMILASIIKQIKTKQQKTKLRYKPLLHKNRTLDYERNV